MKLVINGTKEFEVNNPKLSGSVVSFPLVVSNTSEIPTEIEGEVLLKCNIKLNGKDSDFVMYRTAVTKWKRYYVIGNTLYFTNVPEPVETPDSEITEEDLTSMKREKITSSKSGLAEYIENNPLLWVDGNYYSCTQEKQALLTSQISLYKVALEAGQPYELKWNTSGGVCTVWTIESLSALALAIGAYIQPLVTYQQTVEVAINSAQTVEELLAVVVDYSSVHGTATESEEK